MFLPLAKMMFSLRENDVALCAMMLIRLLGRINGLVTERSGITAGINV